MLVKEVSGKDLRDFHGKSKVADLISNSPHEAPSNNFPATPFIHRKRVADLISKSPLEATSNNSPATPFLHRKRVADLISNSPLEATSNNAPATPFIQGKRVADLISNSPLEAPSNNSPITPIINVEVKRPRLEVSSSPPVQIPRSSQPSSAEGVDEMWTSFFTEINTTSVWDGNVPFGDLITKHFNQERFHEKVKEMELERVLQTCLTDSVRTTFLLLVMGQKLNDTRKENEAYVGEITELKNKLSQNEKNYAGEISELNKKLSEYEKNMAEMTRLKDELSKVKKTLEYSSVEKGRMIAREKELIQENSNNEMKFRVKEDAHMVIVDKLKAEIEELKGKISLQYKAGYDKAVRQVVFFASGLKP